MKKVVPILLLVSMILYSCATIFLGSTQKIFVDSNPQGADIYVNGVNTNKKTPSEVTINRRNKESFNNRRNEVVYVLKMDDYHDSEYRDMSTFHWLAGVDLVTYFVPGIIDIAVGAHRKYQNNVYVTLPKNETIIKQQIVYVDKPTGKAGYVFERNSDIDKDITPMASERSNRFALIIGNEDYTSNQVDLTSEINVDFARNDASAFKDYAINYFGIPESNIVFLLDATTGQMKQGISKLNLIIKNSNGNAEVFVYYAGHGLPDEVTKDPYLMPVDVSGRNANDGILLNELYQKLTEYPSKRVTVFVDACFSGGARNQGLLAARGVKVRPKEDNLKGNLIVFTASSGDQSSLPYKRQSHGFFTYYLLKLIKEKGPNVSYGEIANYLKENVPLQSVLINDKEQTPQVNISTTIDNSWSNWSFK